MERGARRGGDRGDRRRRGGRLRRRALAVASARRRGRRRLEHLPRRRGDHLGAPRARLDRLGRRSRLVRRALSRASLSGRGKPSSTSYTFGELGIALVAFRLTGDAGLADRIHELVARRSSTPRRTRSWPGRRARCSSPRRCSRGPGEPRWDEAWRVRGRARDRRSRRRRPLDAELRRVGPLPRPGARLRREHARARQPRRRAGTCRPVAVRSSARTGSPTGCRARAPGPMRSACSGVTARRGW